MENAKNTIEFEPFLRWAGGKRWLKNHIEFKSMHVGSYYEPFLGSGAFLTNTFKNIKVNRKYYLSDLNSDLISTYCAIRDDVEAVVKYLSQMNNDYNTYYEIRSSTYRNLYKKAARFIYLNRTCFNGLYRVNQSGKFNVPYGAKQFDVSAVSNTLRNWEMFLSTSIIIKSMNYKDALSSVGSNDFVFIDPPYTVSHSNKGFIKYNETLFSWNDQIELCEIAFKLHEMGTKVVITNAYDSTIIKLYKKFPRIEILERQSGIGVSSSRRIVKELVITNIPKSNLRVK